MEIGSREWLIVGAVIFILLIVIDGWRRMRAQSNSLKIDIDDKLAELGEDNYNPELPLGTARAYVPKDTDNKIGSNFARANETDDQLVQNNILHNKAPVNKNIAQTQYSNTEALENTKQAIQANIAQELNQSEHSFNSVDDQFNADALSMLGNVDGIVGSKRVVQNKEEQISDSTSSDSYNSAIDSSDVVLTDDITIADEPADDEEFTAHKEPLVQTDPAEPEAEKVLEQLEQPDYADENNTDLSELTIPDILKAKPQQKTAEQTGPQQPVGDENQSNLSDTEQSIKSMSEHDDSIPSSRDFSADMFEMLLEERDNHNHLEQEDSEQDEIEDGFEHNAEDEKTGGEQPSFSLTDEAKQQEIEALKARLKQLSAENDIDHNDDHVTNTKKAIDKEKESIEQVLKNAAPNPEQETISNDIASDNEEAEQLTDETSELVETTVVDDEVDLEDIEQELINRSNKEELNANILQQLDALNSTDNEQTVSEKYKDTESNVIEFESAALQGLSANDDLDEQYLDEDIDDSPIFDDDADPLMDGYDDSRSSKELVEQFNHDLAVDDQTVSNELDMPISEILKKKSQSQQTLVPDEKNKEIVDPLLDSTESVDEIPAGIDDAHLNADDNNERESQSKEAEVNSVSEDESLDEPAIADNLGFSAFDDDPLMANFEDPYDIDDEGNEDDNSEAEDNETQSEQALVNHSAFSAIDDNENGLDSIADEDLHEQVSAPAKKPRKLIANVDDPEVVLIVTVVAKDSYLDGAALKQVVEACGMEFGDMDVFHRFEDGKDKGAIQFSMTNAVNPGTFDIATMDESSTPGVSFFMSMDEPLDAKNALDCMLATAETVANHLNGSLLDDDHSVLRPQTKEHYKERIRIHEMKKLHRRS
jgi:cell division protein ZipA